MAVIATEHPDSAKPQLIGRSAAALQAFIYRFGVGAATIARRVMAAPAPAI